MPRARSDCGTFPKSPEGRKPQPGHGKSRARILERVWAWRQRCVQAVESRRTRASPPALSPGRPAGSSSEESRSSPVGLVNQGATCYLNSVLQCLFFTRELRERVLRYKDQSKELSLVTQLARVFWELQVARKPVTTTDLTPCLGVRNVYRQQDVLDCFQTLVTKMAAESPELGELFEITAERVIQCEVCGDETRLEEKRLFLMVTVQLGPREAPRSVAEAVQELFRKKTITGDDQYFCEKCDCKQDTSSELQLMNLPCVLVIFLERFAFCHGAFQKREENVAVSATLSLPSSGETPYDLFAVCHHLGSLLGGHYVADAMSFEKNCWYRFSDCHVEELQAEPSESSTAYLLMYHRRFQGLKDPHSTLQLGASMSPLLVRDWPPWSWVPLNCQVSHVPQDPCWRCASCRHVMEGGWGQGCPTPPALHCQGPLASSVSLNLSPVGTQNRYGCEGPEGELGTFWKPVPGSLKGSDGFL